MTETKISTPTSNPYEGKTYTAGYVHGSTFEGDLLEDYRIAQFPEPLGEHGQRCHEIAKVKWCLLWKKEVNIECEEIGCC